VKYQDNQPSDYPADSTNQYSDEIDWEIVLKKQICQEEKDHSDDSVDDKSPPTVLDCDIKIRTTSTTSTMRMIVSTKLSTSP
jgi:hypothetical protein